MKRRGKVYLVGAGPGDPGLLTVKAQNLVQECQVLVYDRLVGQEIVAQAPESAEKIYVGKESNRHALPQDDINGVLVDRAAQGKMVVRLKGGDPFLFGRGGEEAEYLKQNGIPYEIVPGVTSAIAAPAYAGIPVTHRDFSSTLTIITGHEKPGKSESSVPWPQIAPGKGTLVFLMGVENLDLISENLIRFGRSPETPVALVRWGTLPIQEVLAGQLNNIAQRVREEGFLPPAVIVVGDVVDLRHELSWFDNRPLWGKKVMVTRARSQASQMVSSLQELGAQVIEFPTICIKPVIATNLKDCMDRMAEYSWMVFTSVNGIREFIQQIRGLGYDIRDLKGPSICAIGPATAAEAELRGLHVTAVPSEYIAEAVAELLLSDVKPGARVLIPRARGAREVLPDLLVRSGLVVDECIVYESVPDAGSIQGRILPEDMDVDVVTFTSSSTVRNFVAILGAERAQQLAGQAKVACIGPITAETAREAGFNVDIIPRNYTVDDLIQVIVELYNP